MERLFLAIFNYFEKHRGRMWATAVCSFLVLGFLASRIRIEEDITRILPREKKLEKQQQVFNDAKFSDKLTISLSQKDTTASPEPDKLTSCADSFISRIAAMPRNLIKTIDGRINDSAVTNLMGAIQGHLPLYLDAVDYDSISSLFDSARLRRQLAWDINKLTSPEGFALKPVIQADPSGISWMGIKKLQRLRVDEQFDQYDGYIVTRDHRHLLIFITPANPASATGKNAVLFKDLGNIISDLGKQFPGTDISYFGAAAVSAGNADQIRKDTMLTQGITLAFLIFFTGLYFRKKRAPLVIMLPVLFGGLFSLAVIYLIKGHLSVVALGAGSIVLGIAVNYSMHVFNHYRHIPDMRDVIRDVASPMTIGSFTTIGGFLCLMLVPSPLLNDMGLFAAFSLVGATICSLVFLPHWIEGTKQAAKQHEHSMAHYSWIDKISEYRPERNKYLVAGILVLTILFFFYAGKVTFEHDMMRMNYMSPSLREAERKLNAINSFVAHSVYLVAEGRTLDEALSNNEQISTIIQHLQEDGSILKVSGVNGLLLSNREQKSRIAKWQSFWTADRRNKFMEMLRKQGSDFRIRPEAFDSIGQMLHKNFYPVPPESSDLLQSGALGNYLIEKNGMVSVVTVMKVNPAAKDRVLKLLDGQPGITVLDKQFVTNSLVAEINNEFNNIAWMTSLLVFVALFISYGRIELTLITFIPMLISWIWILGIMGIFGIQFNIVNIILSTFIFGLGDDYSIFIMDGLLQQYKTGKKHLSSFKSSIFLSAITTILGLGILIFAKHPSLRSIAVISIVGICCVVLTSQVLIPFLFNWLITNRVKKGFAPWTFSGWLKSVFSFTYFATGCYVMTILGWILIRLNPFNKAAGKLLYHRILSRYTWSVLHIMGNVKKHYINPLKEDFQKPCIVVSNHQSFLDILVSTSLNPRIILLTNQWVWRSPVFGAVVRLADYYPVADGVEDSVDKLRKQVEMGYSIAIYPEGTRSPTQDMKRFHKGAFYIAEQLGLDILPVLIHGTGNTMTKSDFLLKDGVITVKYLPRIRQEDLSWGNGYQERGKSIARYFREEYEQLRASVETPRYFRELLYYNYVYKGPVLEWYLRIKVRLEHYYAMFDELIPKTGTVADIGCGYGFMAYMLHFLSRNRQITGIDHDEEKIATAQMCYLRNDHLQFTCADITRLEIGRFDSYIISDVLHYLQPDEQEALLRKCITAMPGHGILVVRDGDTELTRRQKGTAATEFLSTKAIGFNKTSGKPLSFISSTSLRLIAEKYGASIRQIDTTRYTSNVVFVITKNATAHGQQ